MFGLLNVDSPFYRGLNKITNYLILAVIYFFSCVPIITIGAASTALYSTHHKVLQNDDGYVWRTFWKEFRSNFKQGTVLWLIMALFTAFLAVDCYYAYIFSKTNTLMHFLFVALVVISLLCVTWMRYWFPYISHIEDPIRRVLKNTLIMCVAHLPCSVGILLIYAVCAAAMILIPPNPFTMILLPILYIWTSYKLFCKVFVHYWDMSDGHTAEPEEKEE